jgi:hypothetical protein
MSDVFPDRYFAGDESSSDKPSCRAGTEPLVRFLLLAFENCGGAEDGGFLRGWNRN